MPRWLTFSNVLSVMALFAAIGLGTAFALSRNSVGSKAIKPRAVRASDLARGAVNTKKVRNGSLRMEDFAANQLPSGGGA